MRILVTFAVEAEFAPWRARRKFDRQKAPGLKLWKSVIGDSEIFVALTGIGDKSANVLDLMMRVAACDRYFAVCISSGLAGALRSDYKLGDIVVAKLLKSNFVHADLGRDWLETDKQLVELAVIHGARPVSAFYSARNVLITAGFKIKRLPETGAMSDEGIVGVKEGSVWWGGRPGNRIL